MNHVKDITLEMFQELAKEKPEIRIKEEVVEGYKFYNVCYMIVDKNTFDSSLAREARGIVFDEFGHCVSRPFHKFFNVNENDRSKAENIDWKNVKFSDKLDGSMAIPHLINDKIIWRTKKSFYSDVADMMNAHWKHLEKYHFTYFLEQELIIRVKIRSGYTPLYEFTSLDNQVVIEHKEPSFNFLGSRNVSTGEYEDVSFNEETNEMYEYCSSNEIIGTVYCLEGFEGYVIHDGNDMYKLKTKWYLERHRAVDTMSYKRALGLIDDNTIDDIIATLRSFGYEEKANRLDGFLTEYKNYYFAVKSQIETVHRIVSSNFESRKEIAMEVFPRYSTTIASGVMNLEDGKSLDKLLQKSSKNYFLNLYKGKNI